MQRALPRYRRTALVLTGLCFTALAMTGCDETVLIDATNPRLGESAQRSSDGAANASTAYSLDAIDRARPVEIDRSKYTMIVPVEGDDFMHILFKSPVHAQEAGYCVSSGFGDVSKVIQASDPRTRQSFYFIECEKADPSLVGLEDRINALQAQQAAFDARTEDMRAAAQAAVAEAGEITDPYADCAIGQGGFPIVTDDCGPMAKARGN